MYHDSYDDDLTQSLYNVTILHLYRSSAAFQNHWFYHLVEQNKAYFLCTSTKI